jgi:hypothetical protein
VGERDGPFLRERSVGLDHQLHAVTPCPGAPLPDGFGHLLSADQIRQVNIALALVKNEPL